MFDGQELSLINHWNFLSTNFTPTKQSMDQILLKENVRKRSYFILESSASTSPKQGNDHNRSDFEEHPLIIFPYFAAKKSK